MKTAYVFLIGLMLCSACDRDVQAPTGPVALITGKVLQVNGAPIEAAQVSLRVEGCVTAGTTHTVTTKSDGGYRVLLSGPQGAAGDPCSVVVSVLPPTNSTLEPPYMRQTYLSGVTFAEPATDTFSVVTHLPQQRHHRIGDVLYTDANCGGWRGGKPAAQTLLVDVLFLKDHTAAARRSFLLARGAQIVGSLNVGGERVLLPTDSIPLIGTGVYPDTLLNVRAAPDPEKRDYEVAIRYNRTVSYADVAQLESLDLRVIDFAGDGKGFAADISDDSIPAVLSIAGVTAVTAGGFLFCGN